MVTKNQEVTEEVVVTEETGAANLINEELTVVGRGLMGKLLEVRKSVPYLQKNDKGHQYDFVGSASVLGALREELDKQGLMLFPHLKDRKLTVTSVTNKDKYGNDKIKSTYFTELFVDFEWVDVDSKESKIIPFYSQGIDYDGEKGVGKALTYAEKYFLLKQFNIPTDKLDPDSFQQMSEGLTPTYITKEQINRLSGFVMEIAARGNMLADSIIQSLRVTDLAKIEAKNFFEAEQYLAGWLATLPQPQQYERPQPQQHVEQPQQQYMEQPQQQHVEQPQQQYMEQPQQQHVEQPQQQYVVSGTVTFITPIQNVNGIPQMGIMLESSEGIVQAMVKGFNEVQQFDSIEVGHTLAFNYVIENGVIQFKNFI